jgi:hypothetical protein
MEDTPAANEIERLRQPTCPYVVGRTTLHCSLTPFTLTDEERDAIGEAIRLGVRWGWSETLRGLLERLA